MKRSSPNTSTSKHGARSAADRLVNYYETRGSIWFEALSSARSYLAVEGIHELRVEVKRFRALYMLVEYVTPSFASKPNATSLRGLFRAAGLLRDIDIHQAVVGCRLGRLDLREYFNQLKADELCLREGFIETAKPFKSTTLSGSRAQLKAALAITPDEQIRKRIEKRIRKLSVKLNALADKKKPSNEDLHSVRKASKELRYTLDIWQVCFGSSPSVVGAAEQLKKTFNFLGEWHDTLLTLQSVESFLQRESRNGLADPAAYKLLRTDLRNQAKSLLASYVREKPRLKRSLLRLSAGFHKKPTGHCQPVK